MSSPRQVAEMIGGIRTAQPAISAAAVETLLHVASGADCGAALQERMRISRSQVNRTLSQLSGRGTIGKTGTTSNLRLVEKRKHPHRRGMQITLSRNGSDLISSTFGLITKTEGNPCG